MARTATPLNEARGKLETLQSELMEFQQLIEENRQLEQDVQTASPRERASARAQTVAAEEMLAQLNRDIEAQQSVIAGLQAEHERERMLAEMVKLAKASQKDLATLEGEMQALHELLATHAAQAQATWQRIQAHRKRFKMLANSLVPGSTYVDIPMSFSEARVQELQQGIDALLKEFENRGANFDLLRSAYAPERESLIDLRRPVTLPDAGQFTHLVWQAMELAAREEKQQ